MSNCSFCRSGTLTNNRRSTTDSRKNSWPPFCCGSYRDSMPYICRRSWSFCSHKCSSKTTRRSPDWSYNWYKRRSCWCWHSRRYRIWPRHHSPGCLCSRYICRRSWCWRSRTNRFWKSRHSPDWSCRRYTCRSCWCWRSRTSRTMTIRRNQGCLCRFGTCWDNRTNKKSIRRNSLPPFLLRKRCIQSDIYLDNRQNTIYSRKEC